MYVIMCLVCRFKAPGGGFRNLKFDLLYKCIYTHKACSLKNLQISTRESQVACLAHEKHVQIVGNSEIYFTILIYFYHHIVALRCVAARACAKQAAWDSRVQICIENCIPDHRQKQIFHQIRKFVLDFKD